GRGGRSAGRAAAVAAGAADPARGRAVRVTVQSRAGPYVVDIGAGLLSELAEDPAGAGIAGRVALVTDANVRRLWGGGLREALERAGLAPVLLEIPPGEGSKSLAGADALWTALIETGFGRGDTMLALGGGVVGDLAGFVAATFHRGMRLVQAPTTLLAQVDSSIGGKVAIDHRLGKNLIGAFHPPVRVVTDVSTLRTLPVRERWNGLAEVVKTALVLDGELFEELERAIPVLGGGQGDDEGWAGVVGRTAALKARLVSDDELERGPRMLLNFGHTVGHALEATTGHGPLRHGEAVVLGMRAAVAVSERLGRIGPEQVQRVGAVLDHFPRPPPVPRPTPEAVRAALGRDKKANAGRIRFVVLDGLGRGAIEPALPEDLLSFAIDRALESF
ncbi:MAG TPA: 3-dehydroquinate synthase, partial [Myxococcaceae bacterium]|nr:3-dehydroquinate synthase [Myxococcaceae bacterium]